MARDAKSAPSPPAETTPARSSHAAAAPISIVEQIVESVSAPSLLSLFAADAVLTPLDQRLLGVVVARWISPKTLGYHYDRFVDSGGSDAKSLDAVDDSKQWRLRQARCVHGADYEPSFPDPRLFRSALASLSLPAGVGEHARDVMPTNPERRHDPCAVCRFSFPAAMLSVVAYSSTIDIFCRIRLPVCDGYPPGAPLLCEQCSTAFFAGTMTGDRRMIFPSFADADGTYGLICTESIDSL